MSAINPPGTAIAGRGRSGAFARLLFPGTLTDAADAAEANPTPAGTPEPTRVTASRPVRSLTTDTPPSQIEASSKPAASDRSRAKPTTRTTHPSKAERREKQTGQPSATTAAQPESSPITPIPAAEPRSLSAPSTKPTDTTAEVTGPAQPEPAPHRALAELAGEPRPTPDGAKPEPQAQSVAAQASNAPSLAAAAPVTATVQPLPAVPMIHAPPPGTNTEGAGRISAASPMSVATQTPSQAPTPAAASVASPVAIAAHVGSPQHLTIQLAPPELGKLEVRIDRPADAPARVEIKVEHAHTLDLLSQDQPKLQQALDQAGVPAHRQLVLTLSDNGKGFDGSNSDRRAASTSPREQDMSGTVAAESEPPDAPRWLRSALDITA